MLFKCWASVVDGGPTFKQNWVNKQDILNQCWNQCCPIIYDAGPTLSQHWFIGLCYRAGQHHDGATYCQIGQIGLASSNSSTIFKDSSNAANTRFWPTIGQLWSSLAGPSCLGLISLFSDPVCLYENPKFLCSLWCCKNSDTSGKVRHTPPPHHKDHTVVNNVEKVVSNKLACSTQIQF